MKTYVFGTSQLDLKYDDNKLRDIIMDYLKQKRKTSYISLCNYITSESDNNNMFVKDENTIYSNLELSEKEHERINLILWNLIWERHLLINFRVPIFGSHYNNDTYFIYIAEK